MRADTHIHPQTYICTHKYIKQFKWREHGVGEQGLDFGIDERELHTLIDKIEMPEVILTMSKVCRARCMSGLGRCSAPTSGLPYGRSFRREMCVRF